MFRTMIKKYTMPIFVFSLLSGCASYSVSEQDITNYLHDNVSFEQSVGIEHLLHATVSIQDLAVNIGRVDADRVSVLANTSAKVDILNQPQKNLDLDLAFSAVPEYDKDTGEIFLKSLRLDKFEEKNKLLTPEIKQLLKPAVSLIGKALSQYPVYKLDSSKVEQSLMKSAEPNLVIKDNKLVIELFN